MKYFISQPMRGRAGIVIKTERKHIEELIRKYDSDAEIIDSYMESSTIAKDSEGIKNPDVYFLGKAISLMEDADVVVLATGWKNSRGCRIEKQVAEQYDIRFETQENLERGNSSVIYTPNKYVVTQHYTKI
jgi:hypothetical protein